MKIEIICTNKARIHLVKELERNNIPYEFGDSINRIIATIIPKLRMAIRMTKERCGLNSIILNPIQWTK